MVKDNNSDEDKNSKKMRSNRTRTDNVEFDNLLVKEDEKNVSGRRTPVTS